ncbi:MAG: transposase [Candidatus Dormiibacterota bacterium]
MRSSRAPCLRSGCERVSHGSVARGAHEPFSWWPTTLLAYYNRPGPSNGQTEAIHGRLQQLRGFSLGFRNLTNYIPGSSPEESGFRPRLHPGL